MSLIRKSHYCPIINAEHGNLAYVEYDNGWWCYSCGVGKFYSNDEFPLIPMATIKNKDIQIHENLKTHPKEFSIKLLSWLYSYYVFDNLILKYQIQYIEKKEKEEGLFIPVIKGNEIVAYQIRRFPSKKIFSMGIENTLALYYLETSGVLVFVEDYISYIRLVETGLVSVVCLFGTSLNKNNLETLLNYEFCFSKYVMWLDGDEPGQNAANKLLKRMYDNYNRIVIDFPLVFNYNNEQRRFININTEKDPKCYSKSEIKQIFTQYKLI